MSSLISLLCAQEHRHAGTLFRSLSSCYVQGTLDNRLDMHTHARPHRVGLQLFIEGSSYLLIFNATLVI